MAGFRVVWTDSAVEDMGAIYQYFLEHEFVQGYADKLWDTINAAANNLAFMPYFRVIVPERGLRRCLAGKNYLILFIIHENTNPKTVSIERVIGARTNWHADISRETH